MNHFCIRDSIIAMDKNKDYFVRAYTGNGEVRAFAINSKHLVEEARKIHNTSPIATAALGRTMSAALMLGETLKDKETLTLLFKGDGPLKEVVAISDANACVKGYVQGKGVVMMPNASGHLNVGGALGKGTLTVIRDMHLKKPYISTIPLHSGEIADDLTYYFATSEQTPTSIALGVLMNKDATVREAGGFFVQLLPSATEKTISILESNISKIHAVTDLLKEGKTPEEILDVVLTGLEPILITEEKEVHYRCSCNRERFEKVLIALGRKELRDMILEGKPIETECDFCGKKYMFSISELQELYDSLMQQKTNQTNEKRSGK